MEKGGRERKERKEKGKGTHQGHWIIKMPPLLIVNH